MTNKDYVVYANKVINAQIVVSAKSEKEAEAKAQKIIDNGDTMDWVNEEAYFEIADIKTF